MNPHGERGEMVGGKKRTPENQVTVTNALGHILESLWSNKYQEILKDVRITSGLEGTWNI